MDSSGPGFRRRQSWAAALLPLLLLRALVPAGFMPALGAGSLALVFCEPGAYAAAGAHAHHGHAGHDGTGHPAHSAAAECPFAQSAAPALPSVAAPAYSPPELAHVAAIRRDVQSPSAPPPRHAAARGPPESC